MTEQMRNNLTPEEYIRHMFSETEDGKFTLIYEDLDGECVEEERIFELNWTADDAEELQRKYSMLVGALRRIGQADDQLESEENRKKLLSEYDLDVWNTYVRPYEPMEVDWDELYPIPPCEAHEIHALVWDIYERGRDGDLIEEEQKLWKQYCMWEEEESQKRIPFCRRSSKYLIMRAMRYEKLIGIKAPEVVIREEGRCLAEEMALYYFGKDEPIVWD